MTQEQEANIFAVNLLIPEHMVRDYFNKYNLSIHDYHIMADIFGVPMAIMKDRLLELRDKGVI